MKNYVGGFEACDQAPKPWTTRDVIQLVRALNLFGSRFGERGDDEDTHRIAGKRFIPGTLAGYVHISVGGRRECTTCGSGEQLGWTTDVVRTFNGWHVMTAIGARCGERRGARVSGEMMLTLCQDPPFGP